MSVTKLKILLFWVFFWPFSVLAWNGFGHVLRSQLAFDALSVTHQQKINQVAESVWQTLPEKTRVQLDKKYSGFSHYAMLTVMPDRWRNMSFADWWAVVPHSNQISLGPSQTWHYADLPYPRDAGCEYELGHLGPALVAIGEMDWPEHLNPVEQRAKMMQTIWVSHLMADAWQPLHMVTGVNDKCKIDYGGNRICWEKRKRQM